MFKRYLKVLVIFLVILAILVDCKESKESQNKQKDRHNQFKNQNNFIADANYTKIIRKQLINDNSQDLIAILFTNKNCQSCQQHEPQIRMLLKKFNSQKIKVFRCQLAESMKISQIFNIKRFPIIHFIYKSQQETQNSNDLGIKIYKTNHLLSQSVVQIGKYLRQALKYKQKQQQGISMFQTLQQLPNLNRIVINEDALIQRYSTDKKQHINFLLNQKFNTMPIVFLKQLEFQMYMIKYDIQYKKVNVKVQNQMMLISIQQEKEGQYSHISITNYQLNKLNKIYFDLFQILQSFLMYTVQQFTQAYYNIQQQSAYARSVSQNIYLVILDSIWERKQSIRYIKMLNKIMGVFQNQVIIFWTEGQINPQKKILLGFDKNSQPPLFGKLVLKKDQQKNPLKNIKTNKPLFSQSDIKKRIRSDLGYEHNLAQKITWILQQNNLESILQIKTSLTTQKTTKEIQLIYCTSQIIKIAQINQLIYTFYRFKRFYPLSSLTLLVTPCLTNNKQTQDGFYLAYQNQIYFISNHIKCLQIQEEIFKISNKIAQRQKRRMLVPINFCVNQQEMRQHLMRLNNLF